ncbi:MAG: septum formation initiator family protein [SAR86 cluster bacterium]|jgi:cell division protein FtsB|uniref:Cell division protein FtsB n=1 Tax=SAR86 cluster bacterium TaxID=2030880 RepID=A0A973AAF7_9GAMM|nr:septum formation initiator family protein [SAR86 cluster bacterium]|tara:strand:+ start:382 stop:684 length:303 start_codon:yes stop_codon:yes gene_type:complete
MKRPGRWLIAGLLLVIIAVQGRLWIGEGSLAQVNDLQARVAQVRVENSVREQRNRILRAEIIELKSGLESIEEKARSEFGLIKQGETFFLLVDETKAQRP